MALCAGLAMVLLVALVGRAPSARADADPASDVLLAQGAFYPYQPPVAPALEAAMEKVLHAAARGGFELKVAIIGSPEDLGAVPDFFGHPPQYAQFLESEISFNRAQPLLVVMPAGFGVAGGAPGDALSALGVDARQRSYGLTRTAILAAVALARARHLAIATPSIPPERAVAGGPPALLVFGLPCLLLVIAGVAAMRRRPAARRERAEARRPERMEAARRERAEARRPERMEAARRERAEARRRRRMDDRGAVRAASGAPAGARSRRSAPAGRAQVRRRRLGLVIVLAGLALLGAHLASGGGHPRSRAPAGPSRSGSVAATGTGQSVPLVPPGTLRTSSGESAELRRLIALGRPIYCGGNHGDEVALTFDDGPGPYTRLALAKLRKHGIHATFFVVGRNIPLVAGVTREERALGAVGDHTFTHPLLTALAPAEAESEIVRTQAALAASSGGPVFLFRPPYGGRDATIDAIARAHGLLEILWTVDSQDSLGADYAQIERNVIDGLHPGAIILMHENHGQTIRALLAIFAALQRKRLRAVSVPQLLTDDPPSHAQLLAGGARCGIARGTSLSGG